MNSYIKPRCKAPRWLRERRAADPRWLRRFMRSLGRNKQHRAVVRRIKTAEAELREKRARAEADAAAIRAVRQQAKLPPVKRPGLFKRLAARLGLR